MGDWVELQLDLLDLIFKQLSTSDLIRCGAVCKSWLSGRPKYITTLPKFPWLILHDDRSKPESHGIFSVVDQKSGRIVVPTELLRGRSCCGYSKGWLVTIDVNYNAHLLDPLSGRELKLPPLPHYWYDEPQRLIVEGETTYKLQDVYIIKVALSSDPTKDDCVVMIMYGNQRQLAFCRVNHDNKWTSMPNVYVDRSVFFGIYHDIIFYKGRFHVLTCLAYVLVCDIDGPKPPSVKYVAGDRSRFCDANYMVEFMGDLLIVTRRKATYKEIWYDDFYDTDNNKVFQSNDHMYERCKLYGREPPIDYEFDPENEDDDESRDFTYKFFVYKYDFSSHKLIEIDSLGDYTLFLGRNESISVLASQFPGCKPNSIYFTHDELILVFGTNGHEDMGVYRMDSKKVESLCPIDAFDPQFTPAISYIMPPHP